MAELRDLIPRSQRPDGHMTYPLFYGKVTHPVPAVVTSLMYITVPDISTEHSFGPCYWTPRLKNQTINVAQGVETANNFVVAQLVLPSLNDLVLLAFDNRQQPWVVMWWPTT